MGWFRCRNEALKASHLHFLKPGEGRIWQSWKIQPTFLLHEYPPYKSTQWSRTNTTSVCEFYSEVQATSTSLAAIALCWQVPGSNPPVLAGYPHHKCHSLVLMRLSVRFHTSHCWQQNHLSLCVVTVHSCRPNWSYHLWNSSSESHLTISNPAVGNRGIIPSRCTARIFPSRQLYSPRSLKCQTRSLELNFLPLKYDLPLLTWMVPPSQTCPPSTSRNVISSPSPASPPSNPRALSLKFHSVTKQHNPLQSPVRTMSSQMGDGKHGSLSSELFSPYYVHSGNLHHLEHFNRGIRRTSCTPLHLRLSPGSGPCSYGYFSSRWVMSFRHNSIYSQTSWVGWTDRSHIRRLWPSHPNDSRNIHSRI